MATGKILLSWLPTSFRFCSSAVTQAVLGLRQYGDPCNLNSPTEVEPACKRWVEPADGKAIKMHFI